MSTHYDGEEIDDDDDDDGDDKDKMIKRFMTTTTMAVIGGVQITHHKHFFPQNSRTCSPRGLNYPLHLHPTPSSFFFVCESVSCRPPFFQLDGSRGRPWTVSAVFLASANLLCNFNEFSGPSWTFYSQSWPITSHLLGRFFLFV